MMRQRDKQILQIALPSIVSNITVPLLGLVDVAIVGHMGSASYIGAIAVGSMVFNLLYWLFAFLRMGTSGLTAQALGGRDLDGVVRHLARSLAMALAIAFIFLVLQVPLRELALFLIHPTSDIRPLAATYYNICIWGAPAVLGLYSMSGWYIGMQNTRIPMFVSIMQNVVNIVVSLLLVYGLGMRVEGVAMGTVIAQWIGFLTALALWSKYYRRRLAVWSGKLLGRNTTDVWNISSIFDSSLLQFFSISRDLFLRTLCLVAVNLFFTSAGARQGAVILSVNTLLMQLYLLYSYVMDGFAYAGEALGGRSYGARNLTAFRAVVARVFLWGVVMVVAFTLLYALGGTRFLHLLTSEPSVVAASSEYFFWALLFPLTGVAAFVWDGVFIGITATRGMLASSALASCAFFAVFFFLHSQWGNHALWLAFILFLTTRSVVQTWWFFCRFPQGYGTTAKK